ncbi:hypothetical protein ACIRRH_39570 [Kitasatospora sp. NPDC101235]|uniref:hypothetical protein n=1 Tax=Kitasatospora sp. NPDC101235 TaxID=3364101 RepID=UPI0038100859
MPGLCGYGQWPSAPADAFLPAVEQHTVRLPTGAADWITELLRDETQALEAGHRADRGQDDDLAADVEPAWW